MMYKVVKYSVVRIKESVACMEDKRGQPMRV